MSTYEYMTKIMLNGMYALLFIIYIIFMIFCLTQ